MQSTVVRRSQTLSSANKSHISALEKFLYWAVFAAIVAARMPDIFRRGRFWAEEGRVFFAQACHMPWYKAILAPYAGYLNLTTNVATYLASHLVPLRYAPFVTTLIALFIQTIPAILFLSSNRPWLRSRAVLAAILVLIATPPLSEEVWLNTICSQYHLCLCVGVVLALETGKGWRAWFEYAILALAPLSGPPSAFMAPLFFLRAICDKSWDRAKQAAVLSVATIIQALFFVTINQSRSLNIDPPFLAEVIYVKHIIVPLCGREQAHVISNGILGAITYGHMPQVPIFTVIAATVILSTILLINKVKDPLWLFLAGACVAVLSYTASLGDKTPLVLADMGERYSFAPKVMFALTIATLWATSKGWMKSLVGALVVWMVVINLHEFFWTPSMMATGPSWRSEVTYWKADKNHKLAIWPPNWFVDLGKKPDVIQ